MIRKVYILIIFISVASCSYFKPEAKPEAIARVGDSYLYKTDIADLIPAGTKKKTALSSSRILSTAGHRKNCSSIKLKST
ncbi:hypothetical protein [Flavobacterium sp. 3HN19-14]|uniref:hypothetical protein n=1 Tax=Flavobacterium sp. 3HN19-14 TaxID=3448133 RepID=UPI003EE0812D